MSVMNSGIGLIPIRQQGFTLIEILVTVVVLSIGLLGLAGLQATSVRFNHSAYLRSQATSLAYDIADRMRVNRQAALLNNSYTGSVTRTCQSSVALAGTVAAQDIAAWGNALACALPLGRGTIVRGAGNIFTVTVLWDDSRGQDPLQQFAMTTDL
ncbi:type IV pilus modification protein PilV [Candidatus Contendibacter odensensis]|uniref:Type IV pilus modification protein PilV n=1 Tax=Candidatus Contendobacter odensis Run_B_J11 TaxID=1400861 RepID=A0A7U7J3Z8_9GAMM|nr:type IV pilus modification protein PilV [Candidatus Contendobacter odensis]CDH45106.1 putative Type IV pilus modification protein PilV [Candidatus Contendobacter odensis Run_B_J11]